VAGASSIARLDLHVAGVHYTLNAPLHPRRCRRHRLALWLWLKKTRTGMVIRAGVDDRQMVSALGVNIQLNLRESRSSWGRRSRASEAPSADHSQVSGPASTGTGCSIRSSW